MSVKNLINKVIINLVVLPKGGLTRINTPKNENFCFPFNIAHSFSDLGITNLGIDCKRMIIMTIFHKISS